jgi:hypothetical protein
LITAVIEQNELVAAADNLGPWIYSALTWDISDPYNSLRYSRPLIQEACSCRHLQ